jgi:hypothetical protein
VSSEFSSQNGIYIAPENLFRVNITFIVRVLTTDKYSTWVNDKDSYITPDIALNDEEV